MHNVRCTTSKCKLVNVLHIIDSAFYVRWTKTKECSCTMKINPSIWDIRFTLQICRHNKCNGYYFLKISKQTKQFDSEFQSQINNSQLIMKLIADGALKLKLLKLSILNIALVKEIHSLCWWVLNKINYMIIYVDN